MKKKVLMVACVPVMIKHFNMPNIRMLQKMGYQVEVAFNCFADEMWSEKDWEKFKKQLAAEEILVHQIDFSRSAWNIIKHIKAYRQLKMLLEKEKYEFIHCHTPIGAAIARIVAHQTSAKVIYTAHGFHFFKGAPLKNWILYYPVEKFLSRWTDCLITINKEDYHRAKKKFHAKRTEYVPGVGIDLKKFRSGLIDVYTKRESLGVCDDDIMLLSVGELSERKNHEVAIRALAKINNKRIKYFIAGQGGLQGHLSTLIKDYGMENKITLLGYRADISELCQAADLFVFPSKQEGLSVALMEAVACKTPVICSRIRGNVEIIQNKDSMFNPNDVNDLIECLKRCIGEKRREEFRRGWEKEKIANYRNLLLCDIQNVCSDIDRLYCNIGGGGYDELKRILKRRSLADELKIGTESTIILSVGELNGNKNHNTVIKAVARLRNLSVHYIIAGQGKLKEELEKQAETLGIAGQVHLLGFRDDVAELMRAVDIYCLPSLREGLNVSLMEAMASGLPCLASNIRGNRDLLWKDGKEKVLPPRKPEYWAESIQKCMERNEREEVGKKNRKKIEHFSESKVLEQMKEIYEL